MSFGKIFHNQYTIFFEKKISIHINLFTTNKIKTSKLLIIRKYKHENEFIFTVIVVCKL